MNIIVSHQRNLLDSQRSRWIDLEERDWRLLTTLYRERNITRTAQHLYISQPAVTYRLQQLEREFGVQIVVRRRSGIEFTPAGMEIVNYAREMLHHLERIRDIVASQSGKITGELRLGVSRTFARYGLADLLKAFLHKFPSIDITVQTGLSPDIIRSLGKGDVHIAIVRGQHPWNGIKYQIGKDPIYVVSAEPVNLESLPDAPRINYVTDPSLTTVLDNWWNSHYGPQLPKVRMEVDNLETCKSLVQANLGYAILPGISLGDTLHIWKHPITHPDGSLIERETVLMCHEEDINLSAVRKFIEFVRFGWKSS
jgi:DNA-binding transcriptional LysR family regulator